MLKVWLNSNFETLNYTHIIFSFLGKCFKHQLETKDFKSRVPLRNNCQLLFSPCHLSKYDSGLLDPDSWFPSLYYLSSILVLSMSGCLIHWLTSRWPCGVRHLFNRPANEWAPLVSSGDPLQETIQTASVKIKNTKNSLNNGVCSYHYEHVQSIHQSGTSCNKHTCGKHVSSCQRRSWPMRP